MEPSNSGSTVVALQVKKQSFLDGEIQLKRLDRELTKASTEAVAVLLEVMKGADERLKMQAASKLLEFGIDVKKAIAQDQMQRMIAEIKLNNATGTKDLEIEGSRPNRPIVDFSTIQEIE